MPEIKINYFISIFNKHLYRVQCKERVHEKKPITKYIKNNIWETTLRVLQNINYLLKKFMSIKKLKTRFIYKYTMLNIIIKYN